MGGERQRACLEQLEMAPVAGQEKTLSSLKQRAMGNGTYHKQTARLHKCLGHGQGTCPWAGSPGSTTGKKAPNHKKTVPVLTSLEFCRVSLRRGTESNEHVVSPVMTDTRFGVRTLSSPAREQNPCCPLAKAATFAGDIHRNGSPKTSSSGEHPRIYLGAHNMKELLSFRKTLGCSFSPELVRKRRQVLTSTFSRTFLTPQEKCCVASVSCFFNIKSREILGSIHHRFSAADSADSHLYNRTIDFELANNDHVSATHEPIRGRPDLQLKLFSGWVRKLQSRDRGECPGGTNVRRAQAPDTHNSAIGRRRARQTCCRRGRLHAYQKHALSPSQGSRTKISSAEIQAPQRVDSPARTQSELTGSVETSGNAPSTDQSGALQIGNVGEDGDPSRATRSSKRRCWSWLTCAREVT